MQDQAAAPRLGPNYAIRDLFCAQCQRLRAHVFLVVGPELIASCKCGRALKWPLSMPREELAAAFSAHAERNRGQLPIVFGGNVVEPERHPLMDAVEELSRETV